MNYNGKLEVLRFAKSFHWGIYFLEIVLNFTDNHDLGQDINFKNCVDLIIFLD